MSEEELMGTLWQWGREEDERTEPMTRTKSQRIRLLEERLRATRKALRILIKGYKLHIEWHQEQEKKRVEGN